MRSFILACLTICNLTSLAQKHKLYGTWQSSEIETVVCEDTTLDTRKVYSTYSPFVFIIEPRKGNLVHPPFEDPNSRLEENRVRVTKKKIILKKRRELYIKTGLEPYAFHHYSREVYHYQMISDNEFRIVGNWFNYYSDTLAKSFCYQTYTLKKVADLHYPSITEMESKYQKKVDSALAQTISLVKPDSSDQAVKLKAGGVFQVMVESIQPYSSAIGTTEYSIDALGLIKSDTLVVHSTKISNSYFNTFEGVSIKKEQYDLPFMLKSAMDDIPISKIKSISYSSPAREKTRRVASGIGWLSFTSGLIVAPLISIDYKHGNFNKDLYFKTAGISLGILTVSITLTRLTQPKQYMIGKNYGKHGWTIITGNDNLNN